MSGRLAMWSYIVILTLMVFIIWTFFFRREMARMQASEAESQSLGEILLEFKDSVAEGSRFLQPFEGEEYVEAASALTEEQKQALVEKVRAKLEE